MKTRNGFVSNSSSSSFIVIRSGSGSTTHNGTIVIGDDGEMCFGWGPERLNDFHSKLNFAVLQTKYAEEKVGALWYDMICNVLSNNGIKIEKDLIKSGEVDAYIDHQSSATEGENTEIFNNEATLMDFLFSDESYIQLDNDNH